MVSAAVAGVEGRIQLLLGCLLIPLDAFGFNGKGLGNHGPLTVIFYIIEGDGERCFAEGWVKGSSSRVRWLPLWICFFHTAAVTATHLLIGWRQTPLPPGKERPIITAHGRK